MIINGVKYKILDVMENITISDSFIKGGNKIGLGHGESKLYVGQVTDNKTIPFFNLTDENNIINCFILKSDLLQYLNDTMVEYKKPSQKYQNIDLLPNLWNIRLNNIQSKDELLYFNLKYLNKLKPPRIYLNSIDGNENYSIIREIALPNLSYLSCLKLKNLSNNKIIFYFKIFANLDFLYNNISLEQDENIETKKARSGQNAYRTALLKECPFCPITMVNYDRLLIASHIKPFVKCTDDEKYDPKNGLMLTPTIDKLFDKGFITFNEDKKILLSPWLSTHTFNCLNLKSGTKYNALPFDEQRLLYMKYHNDYIFKA
ncbi:MAG: HNH endonuclease [Campylobacter sp.]|uniref:HNH endonuclease n=1 Tax=Campylobacter sp. TaxID=205 RepID=UPI001B1962C1|nr:HNH endonuclease [Campylobacter sp.]MBO5063799.1 HNH endonuclease [Campylobacter sp.]